VLSLTEYERIIVLDQDLVILRNLDNLAHHPAPAFAYRFKCSPTMEINSGIMVLDTNKTMHRDISKLVLHNSVKLIRNDLSDQLVWRTYFPKVHGLPTGYNLFRSEVLSGPSEWSRVHVLHDIWKYQNPQSGKNSPWRRQAGDTVTDVINSLDKAAKMELAGLPRFKLQGAAHRRMPF